MHGMYMGWNAAADINAWEAANNVQVMMGHEFGDYTQFSFFTGGTNFDEWSAWVLERPGRRFSYSCPLLTTAENSYASLAAGTYTSNFTTLGNAFQAKPALRNAIVRLGWEFNGTTFPWQVAPANPTMLANYKTGFNLAAAALKAACPGLKIEWCPNISLDFTNETFAAMYPGTTNIDYHGLGGYNYYLPGGSPSWDTRFNWQRTTTNGFNDWVKFARSQGKELGHTEWGLTPTGTLAGGGDDARWMAATLDFQRQHGVKYSVYFNTSAAWDASLDAYPAAKRAYLRRFVSRDAPKGRAVITAAAPAFTYYVDPAAAGGGNGSLATPWNSGTQVTSATFTPGQSIGFKRGTTLNLSAAMVIAESGNSANRITLGAYGTGALPIISAQNASRHAIQVTGDYVTVEDLDVRNAGVDNDSGEWCNIQFNSATNGIARRCTIRNAQVGIGMVSGSSNGEIANCTFDANNKMVVNDAGGDDDYGAHAIFIGQSSNDCYIHHNTSNGHVHTSLDYGYDGSFVEVFESSGAEVAFNVVIDDLVFMELGRPSSGAAADDNWIHHNLFATNSGVGGGRGAGVVARGVGNFGPTYRTIVEHNTFVTPGTHSETAGITCLGTGATGSDYIVRARNNILVSGNNTIWAPGYNGTVPTLQRSYNLRNGNNPVPLTTGEISSSPLFVNQAADDYHLQSGSPARNAGLGGLGYTVDLDGVTLDASPDMGAYQFQSGGGVTVPGAPTIGTATAGDTEASVAFTPPASDGGNAITGYTATSSPGGITGTGSGSPITVSGLANGTAYTFTVTATNAAGTSSASAASNSVTPSASGTTVLTSGFEEGDAATLWNTTTARIVAGAARSGGVGWRHPSAASGQFAFRAITTSLGDDVRARMYFRVSGTPARDIRILGLRNDAGTTTVARIHMNTSRQLYVINGAATTVHTETTAPSTGTFHYLELRCLVAASPTTSNGTLQVRLNGTTIYGPVTNANLNTNAVGQIVMGELGGGLPVLGVDLDWDDVLVKTGAWPGA
jgi:hypothetical protein